jgi:CubicO group peptidase (beta-lactamase class C family)
MLALLAAAALCPAPAPAKDAVDAAVLQRMAADHIPGVSIAILRQGKIDARVYGYASVEHCAAATPSSVFGIGSISKMLTAYAALQLAQAGKLRLDDAVVKYLPAAHPAWDGITLRHLLTHTSGIRDYPGDDPAHPRLAVDRKAELDSDGVIALFTRDPLNFAPGTDWAYSNTGYIVLSVALEKVTGKPFPALMRDLVYEPLGMRTTRQWDPRAVVAGMATGYAFDDGEQHHGVYVGAAFGRYGDTSILSTASDLALFAAELLHPRHLSPELRAAMEGPVRLADGTEIPYGFGLARGDARGKTERGHSGAFITGYTSDMVLLPASEVAVVVLTNQHAARPPELSRAVAAAVDPSLSWVATAPAADPDPARTDRVLRFFRGDASALQMTPGFAAHAWVVAKAHLSGMAAALKSVSFSGCDDVSRADPSFAHAATECYWQLDLGGGGPTLALYFTKDGALDGIAPKEAVRSAR